MSQVIPPIYQKLLAELSIASLNEGDPVVVQSLPAPWKVLGCGNYAAVLCHPDDPTHVIKVYAPGRPGIEQEKLVYRHLGQHPAFGQCHLEGPNYLVLKRLDGTNLYDCMQQGKRIPVKVIQDIDRALDYARQRGLYPRDVHGRNVMMSGAGNSGVQGMIADVSDFLNQQECHAWRDLRRAYYWIYRPFFAPLGLRISAPAMNSFRRLYRMVRKLPRQVVQAQPKNDCVA
jgi:hypothetical protein